MNGVFVYDERRPREREVFERLLGLCDHDTAGSFLRDPVWKGRSRTVTHAGMKTSRDSRPVERKPPNSWCEHPSATVARAGQGRPQLLCNLAFR